MPHHNTIIHPDGIELEGDAAGCANCLLDDAPEFLQVDMAGDDIDVGVADRDKRLIEVGLVADLAGGTEQAAVWRALKPALDRVGTHSKALLASLSQKPAAARDNPWSLRRLITRSI